MEEELAGEGAVFVEYVDSVGVVRHEEAFAGRP
jgi:hypothetical protein